MCPTTTRNEQSSSVSDCDMSAFSNFTGHTAECVQLCDGGLLPRKYCEAPMRCAQTAPIVQLQLQCIIEWVQFQADKVKQDSSSDQYTILKSLTRWHGC